MSSHARHREFHDWLLSVGYTEEVADKAVAERYPETLDDRLLRRLARRFGHRLWIILNEPGVNHDAFREGGPY